MNNIRIGTGAGFSGDRIEPAVELAEKGNLDFLVFECLAERTIALAQLAKRKDPSGGFDPLLEKRMRAVLPACKRHGVRIITNAGAANPLAATSKVQDIANELGLSLKIAAITGDDVLAKLDWKNGIVNESGAHLAGLQDRAVSANAYLGAAPVVDALDAGADLVITGRIADPSLFLAPMIHVFKWSPDDWQRMGQGTIAGHLLECAGQVTGGYFADPGYKEIPDLAQLGFPIGEVASDGSVVITKVASAGGQVSEATCKEQLLYEVHDPARYLTPDVTADFTGVSVQQIAPNRVRVTGGSGTPRPEQLKVSVGYLDGYIGEGQISYAGPGAAARARLAARIIEARLALAKISFEDIRFDLIGINALHGATLSPTDAEPYEVRLRVAARTPAYLAAKQIGDEVEALYTNGPAGGGGATKQVREVIGVASTLIPRAQLNPEITWFTS